MDTVITGYIQSTTSPGNQTIATSGTTAMLSLVIDTHHDIKKSISDTLSHELVMKRNINDTWNPDTARRLITKKNTSDIMSHVLVMKRNISDTWNLDIARYLFTKKNTSDIMSHVLVMLHAVKKSISAMFSLNTNTLHGVKRKVGDILNRPIDTLLSMSRSNARLNLIIAETQPGRINRVKIKDSDKNVRISGCLLSQSVA